MDKLEYVLALAEERNVTRAADKLFISQPALTNYINRLEADLGVKLFDRSVQPVTVTEAGTIYIEEMKKIRNRETALRSRLEALEKKNSVFTIGVPSIRSSYILPGILRKIMKKYPQLSVNVVTEVEDYLERALNEGTLDAAIGCFGMPYQGIRYEIIERIQVLLLISREDPAVSHLGKNEGILSDPYLIDASSLRDRCVLLPRTGSGNYRTAIIMMEKFGIVPAKTVKCSNVMTLYQMAGMNLGMLFVTPDPFARSYPQYDDKIAFCRLQKEPVYLNCYVGCREDVYANKKELIDDLVRFAREEYM